MFPQGVPPRSANEWYQTWKEIPLFKNLSKNQSGTDQDINQERIVT
jgi:hypothetical protein